jgi:hypothetical protein
MKGKAKTVLARGSLEGTPVWGQRSADETNLQKASQRRRALKIVYLPECAGNTKIALYGKSH